MKGELIMKLNYIKPELTEEIIVLDDVIASSTGTVGEILPGDQESPFDDVFNK